MPVGFPHRINAGEFQPSASDVRAFILTMARPRVVFAVAELSNLLRLSFPGRITVTGTLITTGPKTGARQFSTTLPKELLISIPLPL